MKKLLLIFFTIFIFGCAEETPESVAKDFFTNLSEGNVDKLTSMVCLKKRHTIDDFKKIISEAKSEADKKGGIESIEVQKASTKMDEDKTIYVVPVKVTYKDKSSHEDKLPLIKIDGKYKALL